MGAEPLQWMFFLPKSFVHATISLHMLRAFSGGLQGGNSPWIFDFAAQIRVRIFLKDGALSSLTKKIHAKSTPPKKILKSRPILKHFLNGFFWALDPGMRRCFWMPAFLC